MNDTIKAPVGVLGIGVEGRATITYLKSRGISDITALDRMPIDDLPSDVQTCFGEDHLKNLGRFATLFRSPGIRPDHPALRTAMQEGTKITSALSHFLSHCPADVVGVTGTLGKGTCASLIAAMIESAGMTVHLGGNIGLSPLSFLNDVRASHKVVLEISSFQAMDIAASPRVAVILKTTSEHLDWHTDLGEYRAAKAHLLRHQGADGVVICHNDAPACREIASAGAPHQLFFSREKRVSQGVFVEDETFFLAKDGVTELPIDVKRIRMPGVFNQENIAAALLAACELGVPLADACRAAERFEGLLHRLQFVADVGDVQFYNDSYATRPDATLGALASFTRKPLALILGGSEKHADFGELARAIGKHPTITHVSLIGATAERLQKIISCESPMLAMQIYPELQSAVEGADAAVSNGGVVLLSPACASFGLFKNYKVRGEQFVDIVKKLLSESNRP